ncbi:hypothetical protein [Streptomyces qinglanensis]|uniref:hypothetical protein n=1 Tax=Streptomyces qinglanensis TaxID=943816 RepID=UPI003D70BE51
MTRGISHRASLAGAAVLIALITGCGSGSKESAAEAGAGKKETPKHSAQGVISTKKASQLLDHYVSVNNRANAKRDGKLLSTVEGGGLLEQSTADYKQYAAFSKKDKAAYGTPFYYVDRRYYIPRKGVADWFAVSAKLKDREGTSKERSYLVFDRLDDGPWKIVASVHMKRPVAPAKDKDGFVQAVSASATQGSMAPDKLTDGLQRLYTERDVSASGLKPNKLARNINKGAWKAVDGVGRGGRLRWIDGGTRYTQVYAMKMRGGQIYSVFNTPVDKSVRVTKPGYNANPDKFQQVYTGKSDAQGIMSAYLHQSSAFIPAKGKPELLTTESILIGAERESGF